MYICKFNMGFNKKNHECVIWMKKSVSITQGQGESEEIGWLFARVLVWGGFKKKILSDT